MKVESKQKLNQINIKIYSLKVNPEKNQTYQKNQKFYLILKNIIKDEYKYQDANIDLNEINVIITETEG